MTNHARITDTDGTPRTIAELDPDELRALRALADAGLIPPLGDPATSRDAQGVLIEQDFTRRPARVVSMAKSPYRRAS